MATTKKPATAAADKEPKPVKASVASKAPVVAAEPAPKPAVAKKLAAKAPAKAAAAPAPVKAAEPTPAKPAAKKKVALNTVSHEVDPEKRANYIEVAAFYIAERRGFAPGNPEQDYLEAAAEIDRLISAGHFSK